MKEITATELAENLKKENISVIDVREDEEVAQGKIPGARHIPLGQITERLNELDKSKPHYMVCRSGGRSSQACAFLSSQGFDVINMEGGMLAWTDETE
ncbi:rhodanese-like domain-containing protein [Halobacillus salinarum]|uniref:Rhodanese-like domain-containing protein n=1 Tax=Halobacillus salinarum TaxID=2932257 RepID=A0ABY4EKD9_9BACI|nr:rhodanese-like domain-containing protein [Halobacillus salinarum]UOQ44548.1 rhodanese-like domain-containing protein [Halobacillus salinarum]